MVQVLEVGDFKTFFKNLFVVLQKGKTFQLLKKVLSFTPNTACTLATLATHTLVGSWQHVHRSGCHHHMLACWISIALWSLIISVWSDIFYRTYESVLDASSDASLEKYQDKKHGTVKGLHKVGLFPEAFHGPVR